MSQHLSLVRSRQMAAIDQATIEAGTPGHELMARAGAGVWAAAADHLAPQEGGKAVFLCGKGNNGGDGFVAARSARADGFDVIVLLCSDEDAVEGDALHHLRLLRDAGTAVQTVDAGNISDVVQIVEDADIIFDGLLGTGLSGPPRPPMDELIRAMSRSRAPVVAIDVPSGLDPDTSEGTAAPSRLTVTFGALKPVHVFYPGRQICGRVAVVDIGLSDTEVTARRIGRVAHGVRDPDLPERSRTAHKGDTGRAVLIAGSLGLTGAACLASEAALRSGAGLVTLGLPETLNDIAEVKLTEVMTRPLPEVRKHRCLALRARGELAKMLHGASAVAIGPGLGRHRETFELVRRIMHDITVPTVIDADGLNAYAGSPGRLAEVDQPVILTPHPGEYRRLTGRDVSDPVENARSLAAETGKIVLLKGAPTVVALPESEVFVNLTGNPGMATGGTGDVLTGMIVGLLAQGAEPEDAAVSAAWWHGLAGDIAAEKYGERGMIAGDMIRAIPEAEQLIAAGEACRRYIDYRSMTENRSDAT